MKKILIPVFILFQLTLLQAAEVPILKIGEPAPDFALKGTDGKIWKLSDFDTSRILMIVFTANHCPTAQAYEQRLIALSKKYQEKDLRVVAISPNNPDAVCLEELGYSDLGDSYEEMKVRASDADFPFPYLYDGDDQKTALAYGPVATPHVFIFDRERKLRYCGRIDDTENPYAVPVKRDAENAIKALLTGAPVPVETTRVFGCSIKWISKKEWKKQLDEEWASKEVSLLPADLDTIKALRKNAGEKYRLVNVWATWCGPCVIEFPELVNMQRMYGNRNFELVTISADQPAREMTVLDFLRKKDAAVSNYLYTGASMDELAEALYPAWQGNLPLTLLLAPGGEVVYSHDGIIDPLELRKEIVARLGRFFADDK
ncbi:MAG: redoxin domain-containing protein [Bacteroidota bacterium]